MNIILKLDRWSKHGKAVHEKGNTYGRYLELCLSDIKIHKSSLLLIPVPYYAVV